MKKSNIKIKTNNIDEYIATFPKDTQQLLDQLRVTIRKTAPKAEEMISYQMPAYKFHGCWFILPGTKNHIGFYPTSTGIAAFKKELSVYKGAKGSAQFPTDKPLPLGLINKIVKFRVNENLRKTKTK